MAAECAAVSAAAVGKRDGYSHQESSGSAQVSSADLVVAASPKAVRPCCSPRRRARCNRLNGNAINH